MSKIIRHSKVYQFGKWMATVVLLGAMASAASATTYYVSPTGVGSLSTNSASPGSLSFALAGSGSGTGAAISGSTIILEDGTYDGTPNGYVVYNSTVTLQSQHWHKAIIKNSTGPSLINGFSGSVTGDICQGIVFGPSTGLGWSGGGQGSWQFLDCEFLSNGGVGVGSSGLFQHCLFSDSYSNAFDYGGTGVTMKNSIARRNNRSSADSDAIGNKESYGTNMTFDGLVAYDNNGAALWFDTDCNGWLIKNSTFFANHGGNNWLYLGIYNNLTFSGTTYVNTTTSFLGNAQDSQALIANMQIKGFTGADTGSTSSLLSSTFVGYIGGDPHQPVYWYTLNSALPHAPAYGDQFLVQQGSASVGDGFITEANDNGAFTNNWVYSNTDAGVYDHSSGGTTYGGPGGITVTNNLFAYNGQSFFVWSDARDMGPATVTNNLFKFTPGSNTAFDSWGSTPGTYPRLGGITFDYNDYDAANSTGNWAYWLTPAMVAGGLTAGSQPSGTEVVNGQTVSQDYLQNPATWNQDLHSNTNPITFWGTAPATYIWPAGTDTDWSHVYFPNTTFSLTASIHQIDDSDGATTNTIDAAMLGHVSGDVIIIPVSAHTPISGTNSEVYDLNGRWVSLTVNAGDQAGFTAAVPPYVSCVTGNKTKTFNIRVTLTSVGPYNVTATYTPVATGLLTGTITAPSSSYNLTTLGTADWRAWGRGTGSGHYNLTGDFKTGGSNPISALAEYNSAGSSFYGSWSDASRSRSWTNGTPTASVTGDLGYIWENQDYTVGGGVNRGWTFTVTADTTTRTLYVWGGGNHCHAKLTAHLGDSSAADYVGVEQSGSGIFSNLYAITYRAASSTTLTVTYVKSGNFSGQPNDGSVDLSSAWLTIPNLITNPGFESNTAGTFLSPWVGSGPDFYGVDVNLGQARTGLNEAWIYANGSTSGNWDQMAQPVTVPASTSLTLSAWVRGSGPIATNGAKIGILYSDGTKSEAAFTPAASYTKQAVTFSTGAHTSGTIYLGYTTPTGGVSNYIQADDFSLAP